MSVPSISALTAGISFRPSMQALHEEAHEAELHAVLLLEQLLVLVAQAHHRAHVDLVEGRQHGGGVLRVLEAARDGLAQPRHVHALFARLIIGRRRRAHLHRRVGRHRGRRRGGALDRRHHVAFGDLPAHTGAVDFGGVDAAFGRHFAHRGRHGHFAWLRDWRHFARLRMFGPGADRLGLGGLFVGRAGWASGGLGGRRRLSRHRTGAIRDLAEQRGYADSFAGLGGDLGQIPRRRAPALQA